MQPANQEHCSTNHPGCPEAQLIRQVARIGDTSYRMTIRAAILLCALISIPATVNCQALKPQVAERVVQVGGSSVVIPFPNGFTDSSGSADILAIGQALTSGRRRLLAFIVSEEDLRKAADGKEPELRQTFSVQTAPVDEAKNFSVESFKRAKLKIREEFERMTTQTQNGSTTRLAEILRDYGQKTGQPTSVRIDGIVPIGIVEESLYSITAAFVTSGQARIGESVSKDVGISAITVAIVRGKPVWLITKRSLQKEEDIEINTKHAKSWVAAVRAANQ